MFGPGTRWNFTLIGSTSRPTLERLHRPGHDPVHRDRKIEPLAATHDQDGSAEAPYECESLTYGFEEQPGG